jgi:hypothetical protein
MRRRRRDASPAESAGLLFGSRNDFLLVPMAAVCLARETERRAMLLKSLGGL